MNRRPCLILLIAWTGLCLLPMTASAQRMTEERSLDYRGGDYDSFRSRSVDACKSACRRDDRCLAYTYNLETDTCYLKDRIGDSQERRDTVSGVKVDDEDDRWDERITEEQGIDYRGGDYDSFRARSVSACKSACRRDERCLAYTYNLETDTCYLKDRIGDSQERRDTVSGIKDEDGSGRGRDRLTEERGLDYRGGDYDSFRARSTSACKSACRRDDRCLAYTYNVETDTCYLKDRIGDPQDRRDTVSGVKRDG